MAPGGNGAPSAAARRLPAERGATGVRTVTPARRLLRRALALPLWPVVAGYLLLSDLVAPAVRPVLDGLSRLRPVRRLTDRLRTLRPYPALVVLGVPAGLIEVLKLGAVYWVAQGHVVSGTAALLALHAASLLATERLFTVVKPQLLTIPWFAALWTRVEAVRDVVLRWVSGTWLWGTVRAAFGRLRRRAGGAADWIRAKARRAR